MRKRQQEMNGSDAGGWEAYRRSHDLLIVALDLIFGDEFLQNNEHQAQEPA